MRPIAGRWHLFCSWSEAPECFQKVAELTPCRRAARRAALPLCEGENKAAHFVGSFSPSQRGRRERSERGGQFGDFLCKAAEEGSFLPDRAPFPINSSSLSTASVTS